MPLRTTALGLLVVVSTGCGPLSAISLVDHPEVLTTGGTDMLFTLSLNPGEFNVGLLGVAATLPGQSRTAN